MKFMKLRSMASSALILSALAMAGCQSSRMSSIDTGPEPVAAAPTGVVEQSQLPAPTNPKGTPASSAEFPVAPATPAAPAASAQTQVASAATAAAPSGPDLTVGGVAGVWGVNVGGQNCKIATPQTKYGQGFRAGPLKCPGEMANVKSWNVAGKQLTLYDESGSPVARLFGAGGGFSGQTSGGSAVSLTR
jgi:hypothetical protein